MGLFEGFSRASAFVWVLPLVRIATVGDCVLVAMSTRHGKVSSVAIALINELWIVLWSPLWGIGLCALWPSFNGFRVGFFVLA